MARIPLEIGEWGKITRFTSPAGPAARANFRDGRGIRVPVQRSGKTPAAAERKLKRVLEQMAKSALGDGIITPDSTIAELGDYYLDELADEGARDGTIKNYRSNYRNHVRDQIGNVRLRQITVSRLEQVIRAVSDRPSTAKGVRVVLCNMFDIAVRHDAVRINLAKNTKPVKQPRAKVTALPPAKVKQMLTLFEIASTGHGKDIYDVALLLSVTGTRTGEFLGVEWSEMDLNTEKGIVRITGTLVEDAETGKLKKQEEGKSLAATRGMTLPPKVTERFRQRYLVSEGNVVFPSRAGNFQWPNNFRRRWRDVLEGTEFEGVSPKMFRKSVATLLARRVGSKAAQEQLGHESDDITKEFYIEQEETIANYADILEEMIS